MNNDKTNQSMSLSQAIRLGAMLHPQVFHMLRLEDGKTVVGTCAIGAAEAAGYVLGDWMDAPARCPLGCPPDTDSLNDRFDVIAHLNDSHRWSREEIATWVEQIETTISHTTNMEAVGVGEKV